MLTTRRVMGILLIIGWFSLLLFMGLVLKAQVAPMIAVTFLVVQSGIELVYSVYSKEDKIGNVDHLPNKINRVKSAHVPNISNKS